MVKVVVFLSILLLAACTGVPRVVVSDEGYSSSTRYCHPVRPGYHPGTGTYYPGEDCGGRTYQSL